MQIGTALNLKYGAQVLVPYNGALHLATVLKAVPQQYSLTPLCHVFVAIQRSSAVTVRLTVPHRQVKLLQP